MKEISIKRNNTAVQRVRTVTYNNNIPIMIKSALAHISTKIHTTRKWKEDCCLYFSLSLEDISYTAWPIWVWCISCKTKALASGSKKRSPALLLFSPFILWGCADTLPSVFWTVQCSTSINPLVCRTCVSCVLYVRIYIGKLQQQL